MPFSLPLLPLEKYMIRDGVPGIVNANKEEQQRRSTNDEQSRACIGVSEVCRPSQHSIRRKRKQNMKQPVLEHGLVDALRSQTPSQDDGAHYPTKTS